jgi:type I restriction enzyme S subunit
MDRRTTTGEEILLSMRQNKGLIPHNDVSVKRFKPTDLIGYKIVCPGQFVMNRMRASIGLFAASWSHGLVSPDYAVFQPLLPVNLKYLVHLFQTPSMAAILRQESKGMGTGSSGFLRLYTDRFGAISLMLPDVDGQNDIVCYIKKFDLVINKFIRNRRQLIALLKEKKQNIINKAVTRGLNPDVRMKPSGVDWIGDVPEHWEVRRLKSVVRIKNGQDYKTVESVSGYPVIGSGGQFAYASTFIYDGESVLFGRKGTINKPIYINGKFWTVDTMFYTEISKAIYAKFLYYSATLFQFDSLSTKTALPSMTQQDLGGYSFALPPFDEQRCIANAINSKLHHIDEEIFRIEREISLFREYRARLISDVVTGKVDVRGLAVPAIEEEELTATDEEYPEPGEPADDEGDEHEAE